MNPYPSRPIDERSLYEPSWPNIFYLLCVCGLSITTFNQVVLPLIQSAGNARQLLEGTMTEGSLPYMEALFGWSFLISLLLLVATGTLLGQTNLREPLGLPNLSDRKLPREILWPGMIASALGTAMSSISINEALITPRGAIFQACLSAAGIVLLSEVSLIMRMLDRAGLVKRAFSVRAN